MPAHLTIAASMLLAAIASPPEESPNITVEGLVRLIEHIEVPARSEGLLKQIEVKEGRFIKKGELLGKLDDENAQLTLQRAENDLQSAREKAHSETTLKISRLTRDVSQAEYERAQHAKRNSPASISAGEFDRLRRDAEKSELELMHISEERRLAFFTYKTKAIEVQQARLALRERQLMSSLDGIVVQIHKREGEWVRPGDKIIRVVRIDRLRVEAFISLGHRHSITENLPAILQVEGQNSTPQEFTGEIVFIHPEADPVNGQLRIWAEIENREFLLRPGQRGRLKITLKQSATPKPPLLGQPPSPTQKS